MILCIGALGKSSCEEGEVVNLSATSLKEWHSKNAGQIGGTRCAALGPQSYVV